MSHATDVDAVAPTFEMTIDYVASSVRCTGTVDAHTGRCVVEAVEELLQQVPPSITIDIRDLTVADRAGADALRQVQAIARSAGRHLRWDGFTGDHVGGIVPLLPAPRDGGRDQPRAQRRAGTGRR